MFKRWPLSKSIILLSLFGVDLHSKISNLAAYLPQEQVDQFTAEFSCLLFSIYNTYERNEVNIILEYKKRDEFTDFYFPPIQSIKKSLTRLQQEISRYLTLKKINECTRVEKEISQTIVLLIKILTSKNGEHALLKMNLNSFEKTESLDHLYGEDTQKTLKCLEGYINYCASLENWNRNKGKLHVSLKANWWPQLNHLLTQAKSLSGEDTISEVKLFLHQRLTTLAFEHFQVPKLFRQALAGTLTHAGLLAEQKISSPFHKKSQNEFIETLLARWIQSETLDCLLSQFLSIFESHVIIPNYRQFSPNREAIARFMLCVSNLPALPEHPLIPSPDNVTERFENYFSELIAPIEQKYSQALFIGINPDLQRDTLESLESVEDGNALAFWANSLYTIGYDTHVFKEIKLELTEITSQLSQFLEVERAALPLNISEAEIEQIALGIKNICFIKSLFIVRLVMAIEDADTILTGVFSPGLKHIPPEVCNLIFLDKLDEWIRPPSPPVQADEDKPPLEQEGYREPLGFVNSGELQSGADLNDHEKSDAPPNSPNLTGRGMATSQSSDDEKWPLETVEEPPQPAAPSTAAAEPVEESREGPLVVRRQGSNQRSEKKRLL